MYIKNFVKKSENTEKLLKKIEEFIIWNDNYIKNYEK
mgnify:FL=1